MEIDPVVPENSGLCQVFADLYRVRKDQGEPYRAKAYYRAYQICENFPDEITNANQLRKIEGVGPKILAKTKEYLETGRLQELTGEEREATEKEKVMAMFQKIEGVGPVTSKKWYEQGFREIEDIPLKNLTAAQEIGVRFYDDINARIPRNEIKDFERFLKRYLRREEIGFVIAGSYRRGVKDSGDIDILVRTEKDQLKDILACPLLTYTIAKGKKKWRGLGKVYERQRRIDIEIVQPEEYPFALLYFTGSARHNVIMRETAHEQGLRLNEKGLFNENGDRIEGLKTERDVYEFLGMEYLTPQQRNM